MSWAYVECTDDDINVVISTLAGKLNLLMPEQSPSAKVAASNQRHGAARGLLVYAFEQFNPPPPLITGTTWQRYSWYSENDYAGMYTGLIASLNNLVLPDGRHITHQQAFYSLISMTNQMRGNATLSLFWRS